MLLMIKLVVFLFIVVVMGLNQIPSINLYWSNDSIFCNNFVLTGKKSRGGEEIKKPKCVMDYNKVKKGVDFSA